MAKIDPLLSSSERDEDAPILRVAIAVSRGRLRRSQTHMTRVHPPLEPNEQGKVSTFRLAR